MQKIVKQLEELVGICQERVSSVEAERQELSGLRATLNKEKEDADEREKNLDMREAQIKESEHIGKTILEANRIFQEAVDKSNSLVAKRDELNIAIDDHKNNVSEFNAECAGKREKFAKEAAEIELRAANYKKEILAEITKVK